MAIRGRKPKPEQLKILAGERADRVNPAAPRPAKCRPARPDHLDEWGLEAWDRLIPQLEQLGTLAEADGDALALYCATYSRWRLARAEIEAHGITVETGQGGLKANPACTVVAQCERAMASMLAEFGLTPSSRARVKSDEKARDDLADFLNRRSG